MAKPSDLFDRTEEWDALERFATSPSPGVRIGVLYGRRRTGKSFLLRRLCREHGGVYHMALEEEPQPALRRFSDLLAPLRGLGSGQLHFADWAEALRAALRTPTSDGRAPLLVIDELPYLLAQPLGAQIPSALQALVDESRSSDDGPHGKVILCGSALAVMSDLLSGSKALRGRAELDLMLRPFDYRTTGAYYGVSDPRVAFPLHAYVGGTPGYRDLLGHPVLNSPEDLDALVRATVLDPSHALFGEPGYLLREDPRITDRAMYHSILGAVADGASTPSRIASAIGREPRSLHHALDVLTTSGFITRSDDLLQQRKPILRLADPIVRFHQLVVAPRLSAFEDRRPGPAWAAAQATVRAQILGPSFEQVARDWTARYAAPESLGTEPGEVGTTVVNDSAGRSQHELDVVVLEPGQRRQAREPVVRALGEAKSSDVRRTVADLDRMDRIRALLVARGVEAATARILLFGRSGFHPDLSAAARKRGDVELIDLDRLWTGA
jgi:uncharacterized protein